MTTDRKLRDVLLADLARQWDVVGRAGSPRRRDLLHAVGNLRFHPVALCRVAAAAHRRGGLFRVIARGASFVNQTVYGVEMALRLEPGPGLYFPHSGGIVLGAARIGSRATIYQGVTVGAAVLDHGYDEARRPVIGDDVVIASGAKVLGGITIGDGAIIGANAVVVDDVPARTIVGGIPARVIKQREDLTW